MKKQAVTTDLLGNFIGQDVLIYTNVEEHDVSEEGQVTAQRHAYEGTLISVDEEWALLGYSILDQHVPKLLIRRDIIIMVQLDAGMEDDFAMQSDEMN